MVFTVKKKDWGCSTEKVLYQMFLSNGEPFVLARQARRTLCL